MIGRALGAVIVPRKKRRHLATGGAPTLMFADRDLAVAQPLLKPPAPALEAETVFHYAVRPYEAYDINPARTDEDA
jgi:hypothetical protein